MKVSLIITDLRGMAGDRVEDFEEFLKSKLPKNTKINMGEPVEIEGPDTFDSDRVRLLAKRFLAKNHLFDDLRVVTIEKSLAIKNRKRKRI